MPTSGIAIAKPPIITATSASIRVNASLFCKHAKCAFREDAARK
jgi:hypothetical protein